MKIFNLKNNKVKEAKIDGTVVRDEEGYPIPEMPAEKKKHDFKKIAKKVVFGTACGLAAGLIILKALSNCDDSEETADTEDVPFDTDEEIKEDQLYEF